MFYIFRHGEQSGPYEQSAVESFLRDGTLNSTDLIWQEGWDDWKSIFEVFPSVLSGMELPSPPPVPSVSNASSSSDATPLGSGMGKKETKSCPLCGEEILAAAIRCKHCGGDLTHVIAAGKADELRKALKEKVKTVYKNSGLKSKQIFCWPVPEDKLSHAKKTYASGLRENEEVLLLGENKQLGKLSAGFVLTDHSFYYYGVNSGDNIFSGSRKGSVQLEQIRSMVFEVGRWDFFVLNGMGPNNSDLIPHYFQFGTWAAMGISKERGFLNNLFKEIQNTFNQIGENTSVAAQSSSFKPVSAAQVSTNNPVLAGEKKQGCFKQGCLVLIGLLMLAIGILALMAGSQL